MKEMYSILIFILINFILVCNYKKLNFLSIYDNHTNNQKKLNQCNKIYLIGGTIIFLNIFVIFFSQFFLKAYFFDTVIFENKKEIFSFFFPCCLIFLLGLYDDKYNLNANTKLILIIIIVLIALFSNPDLLINNLIINNHINFSLGNLNYLFTIFCFLTFINAMNMMDGINLQLASYSIVIFLTFLLSNFYTPYMIVFVISLSFFLYLNYKNYSFLGNSGSHLLGFLLCFFLIKFYNDELINTNIYDILILMFLPGIDMLRVVMYRIIKNKNPFKGDRNHIHHILKNKFGLTKTLVINNLLIILPIFLYQYLKLNFYFLLFLFLLAYIYLIKKFYIFKK